MSDLLSELRLAFRALRASPGFSAAVIVTLALGIGANTAIFSVVYGVLIRPLPYPEPDRLVSVWESNPGPGWSDRNLVTDGSYLDWRDRSSAFAALGAYSLPFGLAALGAEHPVEVVGVRMTPSMFRVLGTPGRLGRAFAAEDGIPGGEPVVLLSDAMWRTQFGADPDIVGRSIELEESPFTVIGVMPPGFDFPTPDTDVWLPARLDESDRQNRSAHRWRVAGRLEPGVAVARAQAEMDRIAAQLRQEHPNAMEGWSVSVRPFHQDLVGAVRPLLLVLQGVVGVLLLIACANIANLFLTRALRREREFAVRAALGGSRARLVRQLLAESAVYAACGTALGLTIGMWGIALLPAVAPADIPLLHEIRMDGTVLAGAVAAAGLSTLLFGLVPAWRASRTSLESVLRGSGRGTAGSVRHRRLRSALLVGELALSLVLLIGAGLLVRSFLQLQAVDHGFDPDRLLAVGVDLPSARYDGTPDHAAFADRALEQLERLPGVVAASATAEPPIVGFNNTFSFVVEGRTGSEPGAERRPVPVRVVTPGFFQTMGIPLLQGRPLARSDRADQPHVVVVNRALAREYWPDGAVGRRISFDDHGGPWTEVVGVVGDTKHFGLDQPVEPTIYMPSAQKRWAWMSWMTFMVRTREDPMDAASAVRQAIWELDDRLAIRTLSPVTELYAESGARRRFAALLVLGFAGVAMVLGLFGMYGVVAYSVAQREPEFGVRIALGAAGRRIVLDVVREGLVLAGAGIAIGLAAALAATRLVESLLFGVGAADPLTFAATALAVLAVALLASWVPARRAARVDPLAAIRHE